MKRFKFMALAALVAFAACDEGTDVVVTPPVTGDIAGVVTIEGAAISGVTVTLSSGVTKVTDGSGAYSFTGVAAGAYTVTISGFASDATFSSDSKAAVITASGQVTVNFDGTYVRTSAILGSVVAGGVGLDGVTVSIGDKTDVTKNGGQYGFSGLRAGSYVVTVSGFDAQHYAFATATQNVTVGVGESKIIGFSGQLLATSTISGTLFIDGNGNDDMDAGEPPVAKAGISIALERAIGDTLYTLTDENGAYSFADLEEGTYKVILLTPQAAIPGAFALTGPMRILAAASAAGTATVDFAFGIITQYVQVYGMLGRDGVNVGVAPIKDWSIAMYPTQLDAAAGTFAVTTAVKTDANGLSTFKFARAADYSPNAARVDGILFAKVAAPSVNHSVNGENTIEIPWLPMDSIVMSPDTFDATYNTAVVKVHVNEIDQDTLAGWTVQNRIGKDSFAAFVSATNSDANGDVFFALPAPIAPNTFPDTTFIRLGGGQLLPTHPWTATPNGGTAAGRFLRVIWDGTVMPSDTIMGGNLSVKYTTVDITAQVHRELDDTLGYSGGDNLVVGGNSGIEVNLRSLTATGTADEASGTAVSGVGTVTFPNVAITKSYILRGRSLSGNYDVLNDTSIAIVVDGSDEVVMPDVLKGSKGPSAFMVKRKNNELDGRVKSRLGAQPVAGAIVTVTAAPNNIQGSATKVDTTEAVLGAYDITGLRDGPYIVTVSAGDSAWTFLRTLKTTDVVTAGTANNDTPSQATRDLSDGPGAFVSRANFEAFRTDTKFSGLVVNDRDLDLSTIDPGEALAGAVINLYRDDDTGAAGTDTLVAVDTTDAGGAFSFTDLVEGRYTAVWAAGTPSADVLVTRGLTIANLSTSKATATPLFLTDVAHQATLPGPVAQPLPRWNYNASASVNDVDADFTFLYANTQVKGTIKASAAVGTFAIGDAVPGMTVTLKRCWNATTTALTAFSGPKPFVGGADFCSSATPYFNAVNTTTTDANGVFTFPNLAEGIYEVTVSPNTVSTFAAWDDGFGNANNPILYWTSGSGDIEANNLITVS